MPEYDTVIYFNVRSKSVISQFHPPQGTVRKSNRVCSEVVVAVGESVELDLKKKREGYGWKEKTSIIDYF